MSEKGKKPTRLLRITPAIDFEVDEDDANLYYYTIDLEDERENKIYYSSRCEGNIDIGPVFNNKRVDAQDYTKILKLFDIYNYKIIYMGFWRF